MVFNGEGSDLVLTYGCPGAYPGGGLGSLGRFEVVDELVVWACCARTVGAKVEVDDMFV